MSARGLALACAACVALACEPRPPAPIEPPTCANGEAACTSDRECPTQTATRAFCDLSASVDGTSGCCIDGDICTGDRDCVTGAVCNPRSGLCERTSECLDSVGSSDCPADARCLFDGRRFTCQTDLPGADDCVIVNDGAVVGSDQAVRMRAFASDADGAPVAFAEFAWTSDAGSFAGDELTAGCATEPFCEVRVTATTVRGGATCDGRVRVYPSLAEGRTRVIVVDTAGAALDTRVDAFIDGAFVSTTTVDGSVTLDGTATVVSAFPDAHEWHTFLAPSADLVIVTAPLRDAALVDGAKGTINFDQLHTQGDIKLAFTGLALPSLFDLSREDVLGVPVSLRLEIEGVADEDVVYPSPLVMTLGDNPLKGDWIALGRAPLAWTLGAQIPLAELGPAIVDGAAFGSLARAALPFLARADHGVLLVEVAVGARPADDAPFAEWPFREHVVTPAVGALVQRDLVTSSRVERDLVTVALADLPGRGFVPLGIGADTLHFAPPHGGLEGTVVIIAALDLDLDALDRVRASFAPDEPSTAIAMPDFVPYLEGTFDGVAFTPANDPGAATYRVRFDAWTVWSSAPTAFALDQLHAGDVDVLARASSVRTDAIDGDAISTRPLE